MNVLISQNRLKNFLVPLRAVLGLKRTIGRFDKTVNEGEKGRSW